MIDDSSVIFISTGANWQISMGGFWKYRTNILKKKLFKEIILRKDLSLTIRNCVRSLKKHDSEMIHINVSGLLLITV